MMNTKCVVYFEREYNEGTVVEDVMIVNDRHTTLTCQKSDARHEVACSCYHGNTDADSTALKILKSTSVPYMSRQAYAARSRHLNNSCQTCNNNKRALALHDSPTGLDDFCFCDVNVCSATAKKLSMDVSLAGCVSSAMCLSLQFCRGFLTYAMHHGMNTSPNNYAASADGHITTVPFLLRVCLVHEMPEWIDFKW